jgi:hypothetical protein
VRTLSKPFCVLVVLAIAIAIHTIAFAQADEHPNETANAHVTLKDSVVLDTAANGVYRVSYSYDFPGRASVYIRGVGTVPSNGTLSYIHSGKTIEFLDGPLGSSLYVATIENPVTLMGRTPDLQDDFPTESRHGLWRQKTSFSQHAIGVLDHYFRSGLFAYEKDTSIFYVTPYQQIPTPSDTTQIQVKVKVAHSRNDVGEVAFTLAFRAQERRSHTDWRETLSDTSVKDVQAFVDKVLADLQP